MNFMKEKPLMMLSVMRTPFKVKSLVMYLESSTWNANMFAHAIQACTDAHGFNPNLRKEIHHQ